MLKALPSTANFTTLAVSNNTVATQLCATSQSYQALLTAGTYVTPTTLSNKTLPANFTPLKINDHHATIALQ